LHLLESCAADLATLVAAPLSLARHGRQSRRRRGRRGSGVEAATHYQLIAEFAKNLLAPVGLIATDGAIQSGWRA
jgi:hypothetical protein